MAEVKEDQFALKPKRECPTCKAPARFVTSIMDLRGNRNVRIFRCDPCRKEIWDD